MAVNPRGLQCFIPTCPNTKEITPDKVFVQIHYRLREKWCNKVNVLYRKTQTMFTCEDHIDLQEDLSNYHKWKLMNEKPIMKCDAKLRYNSARDKHKEKIEENTYGLIKNSPTLAKLLLTPNTALQVEREFEKTTVFRPQEKTSRKRSITEVLESLKRSRRNSSSDQRQAEESSIQVDTSSDETDDDDLQEESDDTEVESDDPEDESDDPEMKSDDPEVESDDPDVKSDDPEVESDDPDVKSDDPEVKSDNPEVESDDLQEKLYEIKEESDDHDEVEIKCEYESDPEYDPFLKKHSEVKSEENIDSTADSAQCIICRNTITRHANRNYYLLSPKFIEKNTFVLEYIKLIDDSIELNETDRICWTCVKQGFAWHRKWHSKQDSASESTDTTKTIQNNKQYPIIDGSVSHIQTIEIPGYTRLECNNNICIIKNCFSKNLNTIHTTARRDILYKKNLYVPKGARMCDEHLNSEILTQLKDTHIRCTFSTFNSTYVRDMLNLQKSVIKEFVNLQKINGGKYLLFYYPDPYWIGCHLVEFSISSSSVLWKAVGPGHYQ